MKTSNNSISNKPINIININPSRKGKKTHSSVLYNNYFKPVNQINKRTNSSDKSKIQSRYKYSPYNTNANNYCINLDKYNESIKRQKYSKSRSNSGSKNTSKSRSKNKGSRPSSAPEKMKTSKNKNNFSGFKCIMNMRNNLISNNAGIKNYAFNNYKEKEKIRSININKGAINNKIMISPGNRNGISYILFGNNNKIGSPINNTNTSKNKNEKGKKKYKLRSPNVQSGYTQIGINNFVPMINTNMKK